MTLLHEEPRGSLAYGPSSLGTRARRSPSDSVKRGIDIVLAGTGLVFLAPAIVLVMVAMLIADGRPLCYAHTRIGRHGHPFQCLKFRTMCRDSAARLEALLASCPHSRREWEESRKLRHDPRVHRLGDFMRRSSLDEIPQLLNVLRGEMSLVGPRPVTKDELERYGEAVGHYLSQRPGITGLWQVSGRSDTSYGERVALDSCYATTRSMWLDMVILYRTVIVVLCMRGSR